MTVNADQALLLGLLACPVCKGSLDGDLAALRCAQCRRLFSASHGVPHLNSVTETDARRSVVGRIHYSLLGNARVYDLQQRYFGAKPVLARLTRWLGSAHGTTVLDIGAGTGVAAELIPADSDYVWFDNDENKLRGFLSRHVNGLAVKGDAAQLPLRNDTIGWSLMIEVSHHIPDRALKQCVREAARVTSERFVFVDALRSPRKRSRVMWHLDLGRFPRPEGEILEVLDSEFELETIDRFSGVNHEHVLCVCKPRREPVAANNRMA